MKVDKIERGFEKFEQKEREKMFQQKEIDVI